MPGSSCSGPRTSGCTDAYAGGALSDGVLAGDLVLKGGGDPKLAWKLLATAA